MDYEAVFWDVGGVILDIGSISRGQRAFLETAVETYDLPLSPEDALEIWRNTMREHFASRDGSEYKTAEAARRKAANALFDGSPPTDWQDLYESVSREHTSTNPGVRTTMDQLYESGYYQAIISDADANGFSDMLDRFGIAEFISHVTTSGEVGYVKPDLRIFDAAFEKASAAGVEPTNGVMIGDKYRNDMEGGKQAGLTTIGYGTDSGPAVDYQIEDIRDILEIVGVNGN